MSVTLFQGKRLIASPIMTETVTEEVQRSWSERLFSLPWQPFKKVKYVSKQVADNKVIGFGDALYAHPDTIAKILKADEERNAK